ncbi:uncharacterized protein LOC107272194 [Cephus cinctus]|uniref:Uncharacterized protein LOC107272194 n=1 Tax=Cephus cinctus TaxID=211228 RepID=A0AAJ7W648_CEPCN|nr:uncharacterized protein LOC107272194 [Cephus cinctus]
MRDTKGECSRDQSRFVTCLGSVKDEDGNLYAAAVCPTIGRNNTRRHLLLVSVHCGRISGMDRKPRSDGDEVISTRVKAAPAHPLAWKQSHYILYINLYPHPTYNV